MNSLYQKYSNVIEPMKAAVCIMPISSCNTRNTITQNTNADGFVFNML